MTSETNNPSSGHPPLPTVSVSPNQDLQLRQLILELEKLSKEEVIEAVKVIQKHNFILQNNMTILLDHWPHE